MLTQRKRVAEAQDHNDPQLHRPQQVSILDGLVGEAQLERVLFVRVAPCTSCPSRPALIPAPQGN